LGGIFSGKLELILRAEYFRSSIGGDLSRARKKEFPDRQTNFNWQSWERKECKILGHGLQ